LLLRQALKACVICVEYSIAVSFCIRVRLHHLRVINNGDRWVLPHRNPLTGDRWVFPHRNPLIGSASRLLACAHNYLVLLRVHWDFHVPFLPNPRVSILPQQGQSDYMFMFSLTLYSLSFFLCFLLSFFLPLSLKSFTPTCTHSLTHIHTHTLSLSHTHTYTHTHTHTQQQQQCVSLRSRARLFVTLKLANTDRHCWFF
jgi:hypothetical protein